MTKNTKMTKTTKTKMLCTWVHMEDTVDQLC